MNIANLSVSLLVAPSLAVYLLLSGMPPWIAFGIYSFSGAATLLFLGYVSFFKRRKRKPINVP